ncbi:glycoside hydrolase family 66 protein [Flavobacterium sp. UW10123]|uniref:glycoside hydrolase family 66 protein n=1 Tax=unclassified Flavobacterium TaxID=196869 RepID=UPI00100BB976|nr:glycoside hydrolase family 66 protein [Flavobacterium sp. YO64]RXM45455.1 cycloisomaltooligosaccharide glucanotransferase [Flavobacterium sp. YO64]
MSIKNRIIKLFFLCLFLTFASCQSEDDNGKIEYAEDAVTAKITLKTDKATYKPGETVNFTADKVFNSSLIRYTHLGKVIKEEAFSGTSWSWVPPSDDFQGYMVAIYQTNTDGTQTILGTVGIDVSSDWAKFPRYGFLSEFGNISESDRAAVIDNLKDYHINGIQFYDWQYRQHQPLAGTVSNPMAVWNDIINRSIYGSTVSGYIAQAHSKNMKAMFYNLAYGVLNDYDPNLIKPQQFVYKDANHNDKDKHELGWPFISNIYITDPANTAWQGYLAQKNDDVYKVYDFDGFHIDQLGDRGNVFRYDGTNADLKNAFPSFISAMKSANTDKKLVMNAVNQYGQKEMAGKELDFLYTEVWSPNEGFKDLTQVLADNAAYSNNTKTTVLAAYMNYNKANNQGMFNTPGVLLTDAVIFAFGGSHLELGEHMLGKEYFPNKNLSMSAELKSSLLEYYDFMTAYQNLLRDGGTFTNPTIATGDGKLNLGIWPPTMGKVAAVGKQVGSREVIHLLNFTNANSLNWRDTDGTQKVPDVIKQAMLNLNHSGKVTRIWYASPDYNGGAAVEISFSQNGDKVNFKVPSLQYWGMIVIE